MKKNLLKFFLFASVALLGLSACEKDENQVVYEGGTAPKLTASTTGPLVLLDTKINDPAITFNWTNPEYKFNTGINSQDVNYILQFDSTGKNFSYKLQEQSIPGNLSVTLLVKELNAFLTKMGLEAGKVHSIDVRVKATLANGSVPLYSNVITLKINPYLDYAVEPPGTKSLNFVDGELWIVGNAVASGWNNPLPPPFDVTQKFTRIDVLHYQANITFVGGGGYKLIQKQGVWGTQYHALDGSPSAALSGAFEKKDADPQFPGPDAGVYKVYVNFQTGRYTLTKL